MSWLSACPDAKTSELVHFISCFMHLRSDLLFVLGWPSNRPTAFQRHLIPSSVLPMTIVGHFSHRLLNLSNHNTTELSSFLFRIKCIWCRKGYHTSSCTVYSWKSFTAGVLIAVIKVSHCIFFVFLIILTALVVTHILSEMLYLTDHRQSVELVDSYCTNCCLTVS